MNQVSGDWPTPTPWRALGTSILCRVEYVFGFCGGCPGRFGSKCTLGLHLAHDLCTVGTAAHNRASGHGVRCATGLYRRDEPTRDRCQPPSRPHLLVAWPCPVQVLEPLQSQPCLAASDGDRSLQSSCRGTGWLRQHPQIVGWPKVHPRGTGGRGQGCLPPRGTRRGNEPVGGFVEPLRPLGLGRCPEQCERQAAACGRGEDRLPGDRAHFPSR